MPYLEVNMPDGSVELHDLNHYGEVIYIGRHVDNDILLDGPGIDTYHLYLDRREAPQYMITVVSQTGYTTLDGYPLLPDLSYFFEPSSLLRIADYELALVADSVSVPAAQPTTPGFIAPPAVGPEESFTPVPEYSPAPDLMPPGRMPSTVNGEQFQSALPPAETEQFYTRPPDRLDDFIEIKLVGFPSPARLLEANPGERVDFQVEITNRGNRVAQFTVKIQGLNQGWALINYYDFTTPNSIKILQSETQTISVTITPPRRPMSHAGNCHFAVMVFSPDYPGHTSQLGATLRVKPLYDFAVSDLIDKKSQTISWFKRQGKTHIEVTNKGNIDTNFRLEGQDNQNACNYEFNLPNERVPLSGQAQLRLAPEESTTIPIFVVPLAKPLAFFRRTHHFKITVTPIAEEQSPRALSGELKQKPLIGIPIFILAMLALIFLCGFIFTPRIHMFTVNDTVRPVNIEAGDEVTLRWDASPFANLRIEPNIGFLPDSEGQQIVAPVEDVIYRLEAQNLLSRLLPFLEGEMERQVNVRGIRPSVEEFTVNPNAIIGGEESILTWDVAKADELVLTIDGNPETLSQPFGQRMVSPGRDTVYGLEARNRYGAVNARAELGVTPPPEPTPVIKKFIVQPNMVVQGGSVRIEWEVEGADNIAIQGIGDRLPPSQTITQDLLQTTNYILNASNGPAQTQPEARVVTVVTPTPTTTPQPSATPSPTPTTPEIVFFVFSTEEDKDVVRGELTAVTLKWNVEGLNGLDTDVQISGPQLPSPVTNLPEEGSFTIAVDDTTTFVLTAINDGAKDSAAVEVGAEDATPTPTPEPEPTATPMPPRSVFFRAENGENTLSSDVALIPGTSDPTEYEVLAGSNVRFNWAVENADEVEIDAQGDSLGTQPSSGNLTVSSVKQTKNYTLIAKNSNDPPDQIEESIKLIVLPRVPPSPTQFKGNDATYKFTWFYPTQEESNIFGFRIYRASNATTPPFTYVQAANEGDLPNIERMWTDPDAPTACDRYYITVVYFDVVTEQTEETNSGDASWNSAGC